ncbi:gliding motility-associated C-terminal domain-containing protein [Hymenobacter cellulosivorans]|uniref:Gliding motility-associated C-terminal domain-containing protein n=1 Tax=Hymenobacter cellulosivorans TaxID=2932249 RepID=A0ABY4F4C2_9BACT|nr:gliding motility-associated C-terminal domain-containing protein [Hymenobacter cellulosivorans]UOQ51076.1 gliding motility-associated C-terminal domain-containing protein [Hymenobacter cellulosivorans]
MVTYEATATVSDGAGALLFYTNSVNVWNRNHQIMTNGLLIGGNESASQGALIVKNPANAAQYYVFVVDGCENQLRDGLKYSVVDMSQNNGLGAVTARGVQLSTISMTERVTAVPHANGRDTWIITHGWQSSTFYSYLLSPAGIATTPITTNIGSVHSGGGGTYGNANAVGYMKASPNGNKFAISMRDNIFELFDFNNNTGQFSNYVPLQRFYRSYGVAFSPNGTRLYGTTLDGGNIYQFNLLAGSANAIAASATLVATPGFCGALQLGPDKQIYLAQYNSQYLGAIPNPDALGTSCGFNDRAVFLGGRQSQLGLPNFPSSPAPVAPTATFSATSACLGTASSFTASTSPSLLNATFTWNYGDPASGSANTGTGQTSTHTYSTAGTYTVTLSVVAPGIVLPLSITQQVTVNALPVVNLGSVAQQVCQGSQLVLNAGPQPAGTTFRWQDGSTGTTYAAASTGIYTVDVTSAAGCVTRASVSVQVLPAPLVNLGPNRQVCQGQSLVLTAGAQPAGTTYRWQDGSTASTFAVGSAGTYTVQVTSPAGCTAQSSVAVQYVAPPTASLGAATQVLCEGQSLTLSAGAQPAGTTYRWQDGTTASTFTATRAGTYSVTVTSAAGCSTQAATTVTMSPVPSVQLGADISSCLDQPVLLQANAQPAGSTYRWQDGSTASTFAAVTAGTYSLVVTTPGGCTGQDEIVVRPSDCPFTIPNVFTPNGDRLNETFVLKGLNPQLWRLEVYNRWGTRIYQTASYDNKWDAAGQAAGTYYYLLTRIADGQQYRGWVEVVR